MTLNHIYAAMKKLMPSISKLDESVWFSYGKTVSPSLSTMDNE
jgi:hypothetical protein